MAFLSKGKLDYLKKYKRLSNKLISEKADIPISTIDKFNIKNL